MHTLYNTIICGRFELNFCVILKAILLCIIMYQGLKKSIMTLVPCFVGVPDKSHLTNIFSWDYRRSSFRYKTIETQRSDFLLYLQLKKDLNVKLQDGKRLHSSINDVTKTITLLGRLVPSYTIYYPLGELFWRVFFFSSSSFFQGWLYSLSLWPTFLAIQNV